jgi:hypothetical protein
MKLMIVRMKISSPVDFSDIYRYDLVTGNKGLLNCSISIDSTNKEYETDCRIVKKLLDKFMFEIDKFINNLDDYPSVYGSSIEYWKSMPGVDMKVVTEFEMTDDEIAKCLYEIKKRKLEKKLADIRQDFGYEV